MIVQFLSAVSYSFSIFKKIKASPRNSDGANAKLTFLSDDTRILACSRVTGKNSCEGSRKGASKCVNRELRGGALKGWR